MSHDPSRQTYFLRTSLGVRGMTAHIDVRAMTPHADMRGITRHMRVT